MAGLEKLTQTQIAERWADITIKEWRKNIVRLKAVETSQLWMSFIRQVIASGNGVDRIGFAFHYYGKFVDMGVGKGVPIGGVKESATSRRLEGKMIGNRRRPKKWYTKQLNHEISRLAEIMGEEYASLVAISIKENLADNSIKGGAKIIL